MINTHIFAHIYLFLSLFGSNPLTLLFLTPCLNLLAILYRCLYVGYLSILSQQAVMHCCAWQADIFLTIAFETILDKSVV